MKIRNFILPALLAFALVAVSCSSSQSTTSSTASAANLKKSLFNGTWVVNSVEIDPGLKQLAGDVTVLGEGDASCFQGSTWHLISNNNTGTYTLPESSKCYSTTRKIVWSVLGNSFRFKVVDEGTKAKTVTTGYDFEIYNATETYFSLKTTVLFLNKQCPITLNFTKQAK
ncbi:MAG: hypothetical protein ACK5IQ_00280 [Bacteroidales bacterium]